MSMQIATDLDWVASTYISTNKQIVEIVRNSQKLTLNKDAMIKLIASLSLVADMMEDET